MSAAIGRIGAQAVAIVSTVSPVVTVLLAVVLLHEPFGWPDALGTFFVISGVMIYATANSSKA